MTDKTNTVTPTPEQFKALQHMLGLEGDEHIIIIKSPRYKKYGMQGGEWFVTDRGTVNNLQFHSSVAEVQQSFGMRRPTEELARKHKDRLKVFNIIANYVDYYAPDYKVPNNGSYAYYIYYDKNSDKFCYCYSYHQDLIQIYMPEWLAKQLVEDLNNSVVQLPKHYIEALK